MNIYLDDDSVGGLLVRLPLEIVNGDETWSDKMVHQLGLESTLRPQGRPKKPINSSSTSRNMGFPRTISSMSFAIRRAKGSVVHRDCLLVGDTLPTVVM